MKPSRPGGQTPRSFASLLLPFLGGILALAGVALIGVGVMAFRGQEDHLSPSLQAGEGRTRDQLIWRGRHGSLTLTAESPESWLPGGKFRAVLQIHQERCTGAIGNRPYGEPAMGIFHRPSPKIWILDLYQPATLGEPACGVRLKIKNAIIETASEKKGNCAAWRGNGCAFDSVSLGGMALRRPSFPAHDFERS